MGKLCKRTRDELWNLMLGVCILIMVFVSCWGVYLFSKNRDMHLAILVALANLFLLILLIGVPDSRITKVN